MKVDLGLRAVFVLLLFIAIGLTGYGFIHRARVGLPLDLPAVLFGLGFVVVPGVWMTWSGLTRVEVGPDRVRVRTLLSTHEFDRTAITGFSLRMRAFDPLFLLLADGTRVVRITRRHPEGKAPTAEKAVAIPGISRPRLEAALEGRPDPDDLDWAESQRLLRRMVVSDEGRVGWVVYAVAVAIVLVVAIIVAAGTTSS